LTTTSSFRCFVTIFVVYDCLHIVCNLDLIGTILYFHFVLILIAARLQLAISYTPQLLLGITSIARQSVTMRRPTVRCASACGTADYTACGQALAMRAKSKVDKKSNPAAKVQICLQTCISWLDMPGLVCAAG
jgi:hypothetical protein